MTDWSTGEPPTKEKETLWNTGEPSDQTTKAGVPLSEMQTYARKPVDVFENAKAQMFKQQLDNRHRADQMANLPDYQKDLAKEYSWGEAGLLAGAKEINDLGLGIKQKSQFWSGDKEGSQATLNQYDEGNGLFESMREEHPVSTTVGAMAPYMAPFMRFSPGMVKGFQGLGSKAFAAKPGTKANILGNQMFGTDFPVAAANANMLTTKGARGLESLMTGPYGQGMLGAAEGAAIGAVHPGMDVSTGAIAGGLGGTAGAYAARMLGRPQTLLTPEQKEIFKTAQELGVRMEPGASTGVPRLQQIDAGLRSHQKTSGKIQSRKLENDEILTSSIFNEAGIPHLGAGEKTTTADLLGTHYKKMGNEYENLIKSTDHEMTPELAKQWSDIGVDSSRALGMPTSANGTMKLHPEIKRFMGRLQDASGGNQFGKISGSNYKKLYSDMSTYIDSTATAGDWKTKASRGYVEDMRTALVDNMEKNLPADIAKRYRDVNKQYAITSLLVENKVINPQTGDLDYSKLQNALRSGRNQKGFETMDPKSPFNNLNKYARLGTYLTKQPGATLATNQAMSRMLGPGMPGSFTSTLLGGGAKMDYLSPLALRAYRFGYPHVRGYGGGFAPRGFMPKGGAAGTGLGIDLSKEREQQ